MNKLNMLTNMGFRISWKLVNIGLYGYDEIPVLLTHDEVLEYLDMLLTDITEQTDNIISLICEKDNITEFDKLLKKFASGDSSNIIIQKRKWRAYLLKKLIDNSSEDFLQGLLELMEFWILMGKPDDCPQTFPNSNDTVSIQDYFTQSTYELLMQKNYAWLNKEISDIVMSDI